MEINIVKAVQSLACGFLDVVLWVITKLGEETAFILVLMGIYLLYSQRFAIRYGIIYLLSAGLNSIIKNIIKRPRPHVASSEIANKLPASGYSFPSGHSQGYFVQTSMITHEVNLKSNKKCAKIGIFWVLLIVGLCVMFSRLYWGQHFLTDTLAGAIIGIVFFVCVELILSKLPQNFKNKFTLNRMYLFVIIVASVAFGGFFVLQLVKNVVKAKVYKISAVFIAMGVGYFVNKKYIKYEQNWGEARTIYKGLILYAIWAVFLLITNFWLKLAGILIFVMYLLISLICTILLPLIFKRIWKD